MRRRAKRWITTTAVLGGLILAGALFRSRDSQARAATYSTPVTVTNTAQSPVANLEINRAPSSQVMLFTPEPSCPSGSLLMIGDGTSSCFDMARHPGQILVLTDVEWVAGATPGASCGVALNLPTGGGGARPVLQSWATADGNGFASKTERLNTGVKMTLNPKPTYINCSPQTVLRGYLLPNQ